LLRACETFDAQKGVPFAAWATVDIKQAIFKVLQEDPIISVPQSKRSEVRGGIPDDVSPARRLTLMAAKEALEAGVVGDHSIEHGTLADLIQDRIQEREFTGGLMEELLPLVDSLPPRQQQVVKMRCGLNGSPALNCREIADQFGIADASVHSAYGKAVRSLRRLAQRSQPESNTEAPKMIASRANGVHRPSTNGKKRDRGQHPMRQKPAVAIVLCVRDPTRTSR
jgi:RNA polymerase primary sigma factor